MKINFDKMHGLGNDFMVVDATNEALALSTKQIQNLADRHRGVGFDQLLILQASENVAFDFKYRIFNADGSEVEQCGNGARCVAKFIAQHKLSDKPKLRLQTINGSIEVQCEAADVVTVDMGQPILEPQAIPFIAEAQADRYSLDVLGHEHQISVVSMGNPHAVLMVPNVAQAAVKELGAKIEYHQRFPKRVNVEFVQVMNRQQIKLRVFERGTGETEACGSGACAAMVVARQLGLVDGQVLVNLLGGDLTITWPGPGHSVLMTGPAVQVYTGSVNVV